MSSANTTPPRRPKQGERLVISGDELEDELRREGKILPDGSFSEQYKAEIEAYRQKKDRERREEEIASQTPDDPTLDRLIFQVMIDPLRNVDEMVAFLKGIEVRDGKGQSRWREIDQWAARQKLEGYVRRFCDAGRSRDEAGLNQALKDAAKLVGPDGISAAECSEAFASVCSLVSS
jgi:hypothetical protein